ncbi:MAG: tetratricopeptide repeat protein, partial [Nitrospinota bacterium]|nr:tetratricopeptide repeat protein [Nitrospinota bacterium]
MEKLRIITVLLIALSLPAPAFPVGGGDGSGGGDPAASIYGNSAPSAYDEGRKLVRLGNWKGAIAQFQKAVAGDSKDHKAYNMLGYSLRQAGRYEEAIGAYNRSLSLKPDFAEA